MDKIGWYINRISLLWTILVVISTGFVCHGQYWLVNPPVVSVVNNIGCYISLVCVPCTKLVGISPGFVRYGQ